MNNLRVVHIIIVSEINIFQMVHKLLYAATVPTTLVAPKTGEINVYKCFS